MPRTKPKPAPGPPLNGLTDSVLTLEEAAAYLRLTPDEVLRMVREQDLHARQAGSEWRFLKSAIDDWLRTGPPPRSDREMWTTLAGVWKDDPTLDELRDEITKYRQRVGDETSRSLHIAVGTPPCS
jgi:excisionase family DNA binding protein